MLGILADNVACPLQVLNVQELLLVGTSLALESLDNVLHRRIVNVLVVRDPHLVLAQDLVHINEVDSITVADFLVRAVLTVGVVITLLIEFLTLSLLLGWYYTSGFFGALIKLLLLLFNELNRLAFIEHLLEAVH